MRRPPKQITARELQVLQYVANGYTNRAIAKKLLLAESTVADHVRHARSALHARDRTHAVAIALRERLIR